MAGVLELIWVGGEAEYFCKWGWTTQITLILFNKFACARTSKCRGSSVQNRERVRDLSLINDLSAVITASDPSERRPKLFGIDGRRKRCEVVGFCNSAGAT